MDTEEAKFLLSCMRPDSRDADDPRFAEAIELLESDPELKCWFTERQAFDQVIAEKLSTLETPADLKSSILAGARAGQTRPKRNRPPRAVVTMIAAAAIGMLTILGILRFNENPAAGSEADFRQAAVKEIQQLQSLDYNSPNLEEIRKWLGAHSGNADFKAPDALEKLPTAGCHLFEWKGNRASLICFRTGAGDTESMAHLVVVKGDLFPEFDEKSLEIESAEGWSTVVWRENSQTYLLASKGGEDLVRRLVGSG